MRSRIAVLASGRGSNFQAILDHFDALGESRSGDIVLVASNRAGAPVLDRASSRGIPVAHIADPTDGAALLQLLDDNAIDLVALAGYLKLLPPGVTRHYTDRVMNVHPGPLPQFGGPGMYGQRVHEAVIAAGAKQSAVTVHFVDEEYDRGDLIACWPVPVHPTDTAESLAERVLRVEHVLFPRMVDLVAALCPSKLGAAR